MYFACTSKSSVAADSIFILRNILKKLVHVVLKQRSFLQVHQDAFGIKYLVSF